MDFLTLIDYIGTFAFAISGIRLASAKRFDWFGAYMVGNCGRRWNYPGFVVGHTSFLDVAGFLFGCYGSGIGFCHYIRKICDKTE